MSSRHPSEESVPWEDYYARLKTWIVQDAGGKDDSALIYATIPNYAVKWSTIALPAKGMHIARRRVS
jgi:hypothetical protein